MNRFSVAWILSGILAACLARSVAGQEKRLPSRTWTDSTGKYKVAAEFVDLKDGEVRVMKENREVISVPLERLSLADQEYVKRMLASREDRLDGARRTSEPTVELRTGEDTRPVTPDATVVSAWKTPGPNSGGCGWAGLTFKYGKEPQVPVWTTCPVSDSPRELD